MKKYNVVSAFDGMSCGQIALELENIEVENYFASEIEKPAIGVTMRNYPNTIQIGDITKVNGTDLPEIHLLIGGSPCQSFSMAGNGSGFDGKSKLFWEYVRLLNEVKPKYFLLENVKMKKEWENVISETLGVEPIMINSAKLTAHDRKRLYWTNIPNVEQPEEKNIILKDILDENPDDSLYLKQEVADRYTPNPNFKPNPNKSNVIGRLSKYQGDRVFDINGKASSLSASGGNNGGGGCNIIFCPKTNKLRRLSVAECERLQGIPNGYMDGFKPTAMYKALGNGWSVDIIAHIFSFIKKNEIINNDEKINYNI